MKTHSPDARSQTTKITKTDSQGPDLLTIYISDIDNNKKHLNGYQACRNWNSFQIISTTAA